MKVVTSVVNNPIFIEIQYHCLKKHLHCDFEFIVFNDAKDFPDFTNNNDPTMPKQIEDICAKLGVKCIRIHNAHHRIINWASTRTADAMNFILKYQLQNPDEYLLFDSDMFLIDTFDIERYRQYECAVLLQKRPKVMPYFWNGIYYMNIPKMRHLHLLSWDMCDNCDTGGKTGLWYWNYIYESRDEIPKEIQYNQKYSNNIYYMYGISSGYWDINTAPESIKNNAKLLEFLETDPRSENGKFFCDLFEYTVLHYRSGGNWRNEGLELHKTLSEKLKKALVDE